MVTKKTSSDLSAVKIAISQFGLLLLFFLVFGFSKTTCDVLN